MSDYQFQVNRPINQVKEYFKSRKLYVQFAVLIALLSGICIALFLYYRRENFDLLTNTGFVAETFSDKWNDGNSEVKQTSSTMDEIQYWYRLQNKFAYPYAGLLFRKRDYALFSLENYKLILDIAVTQNQRLPVRIVNFEEGLSKRNDYNTFRLISKIILWKKVKTIWKYISMKLYRLRNGGSQLINLERSM